MKPVFQTRIHAPEDGVIGNCFRACIASIIECGIDDIPKIEEQGMEKWDWSELLSWFRDQGWVMLTIDVNSLVAPCYPTGCHYIGNGVGPTGVRHAVVFFEGKPVHDPHAGWIGNIKVDDIDIFLKIK